jgi:pyruvate dehydrogenase E1 component beta subunit
VASIIQEKAFDELDAPVGRVSTIDAPAIYSPPVERRQLPESQRVIAKVLQIC